MQLLLIFRKENGVFPDSTNEVAYGNPEAYTKDQNIKAIPWSIVDEDRIASRYKLDGDSLTYEPPAPHIPSYSEQRLKEYSSIPLTDQIDALLKFALASGLQPDMTKAQDTPEGLAARVLAIKEKYPKPDEVEP